MRSMAVVRMVVGLVALLGGAAVAAEEVGRTPDAAPTPVVTAARGVTPISGERTVEGVVVDIGLGGQRGQRTPRAAAVAAGGGGQGRGGGKGRGDGGGRGRGDGSGGGGKGRGDGSGGGKGRDAARAGGGGGGGTGGGGGGGGGTGGGGGRGDGSGRPVSPGSDTGGVTGGGIEPQVAGGAAGDGGRRGGGGGDGRGDGSGGGGGARRADQAGADQAGARQGRMRQGRSLRRGQLMLEVDGKQVLVDLGRAQIKANPPIAIGDRLTVTGSEGRGGRKALRATRVVRGGETYDIAPARVVTPGRVPGTPRRESATVPAPASK